MPSLPKHILSHPKLIHEYRPNVAGVIQRADGKLLWCERNKPPFFWQFPQGGVNKGETLEEALFRELTEEIGLKEPQKLITIQQKRETKARYIFPEKIIHQYLNQNLPSYIGQEQTWFLLSFSGSDQDINLNAEGQNREFRSFYWGGTEYIHRVSYHKRKTYKQLFAEFSLF